MAAEHRVVSRGVDRRPRRLPRRHCNATTQAERRCTLEHELQHVDRGPAPAWRKTTKSAWSTSWPPAASSADDQVEAMVWSFDEHEAADELWVDVGMVRA
jgi:hypothetical protein